MFTFIYKRLENSIPNWSTHLQFPRCNASVFASRSVSSLVREDDKLGQDSVLASYLVNSCGLSRKRAEAVTSIHGLKMNSSVKANSVLELLKNHGFTTADFSKLFNSAPRLLSTDPEKILLPKIQFFYSVGFSKDDFRYLVCRNPVMLRRSLEKHILPLHGFIRSVLQDDKKTVMALKHGGWLLLRPPDMYLIPNISLLRDNGVPQSGIGYLLLNHPGDFLMKHSDFCKVVKEAMELGFHPKKSVFLMAIHALSKGYESTRGRCIKIYKEFGWSDINIGQAFLKHPPCLLVSEKKLRSTLEFLVKKADYQVEEIACCSCILCLSLERRTIPRCSVIQALSLMGLTEKRFSLRTVLSCSEANFLDKFVHKYVETAPQLLNVYQGKLDPFQSNSAHFLRSSN